MTTRNKLLLNGTKSTPTIVLDPSSGVFEFAGNSLPENASEFFTPVLEWLRNELPSIPEAVFTFRLNYFSTSSMKAIFMVLKTIQEAQVMHGRDLVVRWQIEDEDEFMMEAADSFEELLGTAFQRVAIDRDEGLRAQQRLEAMLATAKAA